MTILAVAAGGAFGAVTRYLLAVKLYGQFGLAFPWGTLGVNLIGSFMLGVVLGLVEERGSFTPEQRSFLTTGFIGGLTTFSSFVGEYWEYAREGDLPKMAAYVVLSLVFGFLAFTVGHASVAALDG